MFLLICLSKSSWFCPATSPPHLSGCDEDALHVGPAEQVKLLDLTGTPRGLATLVSQRLSWRVGCSWGNNFGFKSLFCGNRTRAQTNAESLLAQPDSPVQIPSLWQGKVRVPFPLIVFYKLRFLSLYCYFHLSIWLRREETRCCVTNHSYLQSVGILINCTGDHFLITDPAITYARASLRAWDVLLKTVDLFICLN